VDVDLGSLLRRNRAATWRPRDYHDNKRQERVRTTATATGTRAIRLADFARTAGEKQEGDNDGTTKRNDNERKQTKADPRKEHANKLETNDNSATRWQAC